MHRIPIRKKTGTHSQPTHTQHLLLLQGKEAQTCLKYAVEVQLLRSTRITGVLEPLLERMVYSDLTVNLNALKAHIEGAAVHRQVQELQAAGRWLC